jgi:hypothetical protein
MLEQTWGPYFKPEVQKRGREDFTRGLAVVANASDTQINGYVKASPLAKVAFRSEDISSSIFTVDCSCPVSVKGNFCKHIWAILILVEQKHPDFLDSKTAVEKAGLGKPVAENPYKAKQAEYQKQQYQKQKARAKEQRFEKKRESRGGTKQALPVDVETALRFFSENGFPLNESGDEETLKKAKKDLSRVFHPDKGGSHDEAVVLNRHYETLIQFFSK